MKKDPLTWLLVALLGSVAVCCVVASLGTERLAKMAPSSSAEYASWVQAIGSVGAIFVAIWIMSEQHRRQLAATAQEKRQREILQCNRALLALDGAIQSIASTQLMLLKYQPLPQRRYDLLHLWRIEVDPDFDLDALAFLVGEGAQDLLNEISRVRADACTWKNIHNHLTTLATDVLNPKLEVAFVAKGGTALTPTECAAAAGFGVDGALRDNVRDLGNWTARLFLALPVKREKIRDRVIQLYPGATLPM